ncbi:MAG: ferredoxin--NADP reductase [Bdellovibrionales bacterium]|nr:ferredoxin--NADP reductase [Bdellovibrionales bacterium]
MSVDYYPLKVSRKVREAEDSFSFYFSVPKEHEGLFQYRPAQFLTFQFEIEGQKLVRSYSVASSPFLNEPLRTTVKRVSGGVVSNYMIDHIKEGDTVLSQIPLGEFYKPPKSLKPGHYILFAAGIGITPLFSIIKTVLDSSDLDKITLIYSNRTPESIIYKKELKEWQDKHKDRFFIHPVFSKTEGRLDKPKLTQLLTRETLKDSLFYLCGPKDYMNMVSEFLTENQVQKDQISTEDFKVVPIRGPKPDENSVFFTASVFEEGEPEELKALIDGEEVTIPLNREKSLLEQLLDKGYDAPFSCTSGTCMTCMAKLKEGKTFQLEEGILDEENIQNLEILTCQSYPLSRKVIIDYEDL